MNKSLYLHPTIKQRGVRVVEGARLESVYTPKVYRGFESLPLCKIFKAPIRGFFVFESLISAGNQANGNKKETSATSVGFGNLDSSSFWDHERSE